MALGQLGEFIPEGFVRGSPVVNVVIPLMSTLSDEDLWQALEAPAYVSPPQNFGCHGVIESEDCHP